MFWNKKKTVFMSFMSSLCGYFFWLHDDEKLELCILFAERGRKGQYLAELYDNL